MAKLIITENGQDKIYEIADDSFTIGSGEGADCFLRDPTTSSTHLDVKRTKQGFRIVDCETSGGTRVNGKAVNEHILANGDTIEIGETKITYIGAERSGRARAGGRRPAQKAAAQSSASDTIERRARRDKSWDKSMTPAARATVAITITVVILGVLYWALANTGEPSDPYDVAASNLEHMVETRGMELINEMEADLRTLQSMAVGAEQRNRASRLKEAIAAKRVRDTEIDRTSVANRSYRDLSNYRKRNPGSFDRIREMCQEYLSNFDDLDTVDEKRVRKIIANLEGKTLTPEERTLAQVIDDADVLLRKKEFRKSMAVLRGADPTIAALYSEEIEKKATWVRKRSRQVLTVRKNDIRHAIRLNNLTLAHELLEDLFDKLVLITIEDYLKAPDKGYRNPDNARLELETQKLLKKKLSEVKRQRGL